MKKPLIYILLIAMSENGGHVNLDASQVENAGPSVFVGIDFLRDRNPVGFEAADDWVGNRVVDRAGDWVDDDDDAFMDEFLPPSLAADIIAAAAEGNSSDDDFLPPLPPILPQHQDELPPPHRDVDDADADGGDAPLRLLESSQDEQPQVPPQPPLE
jgi:hypothetical protein